MSRYDTARYGPKVCTGCGVEKSIEAFGRRNRTPDGRKARCKDCERVSQRDHYARNREAMRAKGRRLYNSERAVAALAAWRSANPEKKAAHSAVEYAVKTGKLQRPALCEGCGDECTKPHAHHEDYAKQLDVRWLCPSCHRAVHTYAREEAA